MPCRPSPASFADFAGNNSNDLYIRTLLTERPGANLNNMRYEFYNHPTKIGWYRVIDTKWMMVCDFEAHRFNESQLFPDMGHLPTDPQKIATAMRELGDWVYQHHYSDAMPVPTYELRLSEDDSQLHIIRHKHPIMDAVFETDDLKAIADALAKASQFVNKVMRRNENGR